MPRAACRVAEGDVLRSGYVNDVLVLLVRCDVVLHEAVGGVFGLRALDKAALGEVEHPQPSERVVHHVAHDPVGREELRGGRDVFHGRLALAVEVLAFELAVVELVHPAHDLDVVPGLLRDVRYQAVEYVGFELVEQVLRKR